MDKKDKLKVAIARFAAARDVAQDRAAGFAREIADLECRLAQLEQEEENANIDLAVQRALGNPEAISYTALLALARRLANMSMASCTDDDFELVIADAREITGESGPADEPDNV